MADLNDTTITETTHKTSYYHRMKHDPEFKKKRSEYAKKYNREKMEARNAQRRAWALANPERTKEIARASRTKTQIAYIFRNIRKRARKLGREFNITLSDITIPEKCPIFGVPLVYGATLANCDFAPSIDRIDSSKGYIKGNIQVMSRLANCMKWTATEEQLIAFAEGILRIYKK